jgi:hypothetical protein
VPAVSSSSSVSRSTTARRDGKDGSIMSGEQLGESVTTVSAPWAQSAPVWPMRSTPMTKPNPRSAALRPGQGSPQTRRPDRVDSGCGGAGGEGTRWGFPARWFYSAVTPSTHSSNSAAILAASRTAPQLTLEDTTARAGPRRGQPARSPHSVRIFRMTTAVLALPSRAMVRVPLASS